MPTYKLIEKDIEKNICIEFSSEWLTAETYLDFVESFMLASGWTQESIIEGFKAAVAYHEQVQLPKDFEACVADVIEEDEEKE